MANGSIRVGVIGTSKRAAWYVRRLPADLEQAVQIVALADPDESKRAMFQDLLCRTQAPSHYDSGDAMLADEDLDAVVIASPNKFHSSDSVRAFTRGLATLLEKPVAVSLSECRRLSLAQRDAGSGNLVVGFVLRYTPFYSRVKEVIASGSIGDVLAIEADESLGTAQTVAFHKGWRRHDDVAGSFILEKCCHDFDMLTWLVRAQVRRVFSIGHRTHFTAQTSVDDRYSRYATVNQPKHSEDYGDSQIQEVFFTPGEGSPYEVPADSPDHQTVMLEYTRGPLVTFAVCMGQPRTNRSIRVFGTNSSLEGDIGLSTITIYRLHVTGDGHDIEQITVPHDRSGHHGADSIIADAFWRTAITGMTTLSRAGLNEGIEAVLVGLAAEQSRRTGQPVDIGTLRSDVYGLAADQAREGRVTHAL